MNTPSNVVPGSPLESQGTDAQRIAPAAVSNTRPMYWSVRRELWENRSIYIAPMVAAAVILFGFSISTIYLPGKMRAALALDPSKQREALAMPYDLAAGLIMVTALIVGVFYCLDALHAERRDRSILFWKSLPVSDLTTVLSKASIRWLFCTARLLDHRCNTVDHAAAEHRSAIGERGECRNAMDTGILVPDVLDAVLPPSDRACALACTNLRLAAAGLSLGAEGGISMGRLTAARNLRRRENCVQ